LSARSSAKAVTRGWYSLSDFTDRPGSHTFLLLSWRIAFRVVCKLALGNSIS
jgi:hypothetical protein